jgi:hypothetical protein
MSMRARLFALTLVSGTAVAGEVQVDGFYRARGRAFSNLTIDGSLPESEGPTAWIQHRFWVQPRFVVNDKVAVYSEVRALDGVTWGQTPSPEFNPQFWPDRRQPGLRADLFDVLPPIYTDDLRAPTDVPNDGLPRSIPDISLWRVWAEVHGQTGTWRFGRMPIHWGLGIWQNDGLGLNGDFGDSADRVQWERAFGDIFLRVAGEVDAYGMATPGVREVVGGNAAVAWRGERLEIGINSQVKHAFPLDRGAAPLGGFLLNTTSAAFDAELGNLRVGAEVVARLGQGALNARYNDHTVLAFGGVVAAQLDTEKFNASLEGGFATGDGDETNNRLTTFTFDRDYNIGILLFEQPLPMVRLQDGTRSVAQALSGNGISNALFARAQGTYHLPYGVSAELGVAAARTFKRSSEYSDQTVYGVEIDLGARYRATEHLDLVGTSAVMIPGNFYRNATLPGVADGLQGVIFGGQVLGRVSF